MGLRLIIGRSGTGKTETCMREIAERQGKQNGRLIFIVPEQYSSQAEQDLIERTKGKGILQGEVLSFGRLAHHVFSKKGIGKRVPLGDTGKSMVLRKILMEQEENLSYFRKTVDKQGFVEQLSLTMTELFQYHIQPEQIEEHEKSKDLSQTVRGKLGDLKTIYRGYLDFLKNEYISGDEMLDLLAERLANEEGLEETEIWVDGFYGFTPQEFRVLGQLMRLAKQVNITLTMDEYSLNQKSLPLSAPFFEPFLTTQNLKKIALEEGIKVLAPFVLEENKRTKADALCFLEKNYFYYYGKTSDLHDGISLFAAAEKYSEIRYAASKIIHLVREEGLRFREIAIVTNSMSDYEKSLRGILREYGIPYFIDAKRQIIAHPLIEFVRSALDIMVYHFTYESVFRYLKTGLASLGQEEIDSLENFVLAYGIKGYKWHQESWEYGFREGMEEEYTKINDIKERVVAPLRPFYEGINRNKKYPLKNMSIFLTDVLNTHHVAEQLEDWSERAWLEGNGAKAREHQQIWGIFVNLLEKMVQILGEEEMTVSEFAKILEAGLVKSDLGIIPPTADSILVGDIERSRLPAVKALFVLGVNEGVLPMPKMAQGIFSDEERAVLEQTGMEMAPGGKRRAFEEQYLIYRGITKPSSRLYFSYCTGDLEGKALRPSSLISRIKMLFPVLSEDKDSGEVITTADDCFHGLGHEMRKGTGDNGMTEVWKDIYSYYESHAKWQEKLRMLKEGLTAEVRQERLSHNTVKRMYGKELVSSVSKLERYATCPFAYFAEYGLRAKERKLYQLQAPDLGTLFHEVLEVFVQTLDQGHLNWDDMSKEETEAIIESAVEDAAPRLGNEVLLDTAANQYLIRRLKRISKRAAWTLTEHMKKGDFRPFGYEIGFGRKEVLPPIILTLSGGERLVLRGKIDRVDILDKDNSRYVKIIDYKSGNKEFSFRDIYYGLQLQLLIYMDAFIKTCGTDEDRSLKPGGVFYFRVKDPSVKVTKEMSSEEIYDTLFRELRMSGLVLDDADVIKGMDNIFDGGEDGLSQGSSSIIPVTVNKDGSYKKGGADVADEGKYDKLMTFAGEKAREIGDSILQGEIAPSPYKKENQVPCTYCNYQSVCRFEPSGEQGGYRELKNKKAEDFWSIVLDEEKPE